MDPSFIYKKLDEACIGHDEAKRWVVSNVSAVLRYIDDLEGQQEKDARRIEELENEAEDADELRDSLSDTNSVLDDVRALVQELDGVLNRA